MNCVSAMHKAIENLDTAIYFLEEREETARDIGLSLHFNREIYHLKEARYTLKQGLKNENEHNSKVLSNTFAGIDWAHNMIKQLKE